MENTIYNIILANGTEIHATINGNNYITDDAVNIEILSDANLSNVNIGGVDYKDMTCTNIWNEDGHTRFIIREMTEAEKMKQSMEDATLNKLAKYVQNQLGIQTLECNYDINNEKCIECSRRIKANQN